jgi:Rieske Fe-S protein
LSPICPHAGCSVEQKENTFVCPCHDAKFDAKGARKEGPAPRDLDPLTLSVANIDGKPWLHVTWQDFVTGTEERVART